MSCDRCEDSELTTKDGLWNLFIYDEIESGQTDLMFTLCLKCNEELKKWLMKN